MYVSFEVILTLRKKYMKIQSSFKHMDWPGNNRDFTTFENIRIC